MLLLSSFLLVLCFLFALTFFVIYPFFVCIFVSILLSYPVLLSTVPRCLLLVRERFEHFFVFVVWHVKPYTLIMCIYENFVKEDKTNESQSKIQTNIVFFGILLIRSCAMWWAQWFHLKLKISFAFFVSIAFFQIYFWWFFFSVSPTHSIVGVQIKIAHSMNRKNNSKLQCAQNLKNRTKNKERKRSERKRWMKRNEKWALST